MILSGCINKVVAISLLKVIKISLFIIILSGLLSFSYFNILLIEEGSFLTFEATMRPGFPFIAISSGCVTGFIFWYFYYFSLILVDFQNRSIFDWIIILSGIVFIFATSRRIIFLSFFISFIIVFLIFLLFLKNNRKEVIQSYKKITCILLTLIAVTLIFLIKSKILDLDAFDDFFEKTGNASDAERIKQYNALIKGWLANPIFGAGTGINAGVIRSKIPGGYELTYIAKLFETGLIGIIVYISLYCSLFYWTIKSISNSLIPSKYIIACTGAMSIFMISNATNPYFGAFDYMWFMYTPFVGINLLKYKKDGKN